MSPSMSCRFFVNGSRCGKNANQAVVSKREHGESTFPLCNDHVKPWCVLNDTTLDAILGIKGEKI